MLKSPPTKAITTRKVNLALVLNAIESSPTKLSIPLYDWLRENGWKQVNNRNYQLGTYEKRIEE